MTEPMFRPLSADDVEVVKWVLYNAVGWDPQVTLPPLETVVAHPQLVVFHEDWGRPGDLGTAAEADGELMGAVFCRLFTNERHGEGFVDETTPELGVAVAKNHRGIGLGTRLMRSLEDQARGAGIARLGLSVQKANPALRLYRRLGYRRVAESTNDFVMVLEL